jgi:hypothetical protein
MGVPRGSHLRAWRAALCRGYRHAPALIRGNCDVRTKPSRVRMSAAWRLGRAGAARFACVPALPLHAVAAILRYCRSRLCESAATSRRGGRVVECGGLENRLAGIPRYEGSNPSLSAIELGKRGPGRPAREAGIAVFSGRPGVIRRYLRRSEARGRGGREDRFTWPGRGRSRRGAQHTV